MRTYAIVAEESPPPPGPQEPKKLDGGMLQMLLPLILIFGVFYLLVWRPQSKKRKDEEKKRQDMLASLQKSAHVVTIGGIHGIVASVGQDEVVLKIDEKSDVRIRVSRSAIHQVIGPEGEDEKKKDQ